MKYLVLISLLTYTACSTVSEKVGMFHKGDTVKYMSHDCRVLDYKLDKLELHCGHFRVLADDDSIKLVDRFIY